MSTHYEKSVNLKSRTLGTEIDFGMMLVNICHIELSLGDSRRAARALSEARGIHNLMLAILQHPRATRALRRKALTRDKQYFYHALALCALAPLATLGFNLILELS